MKRLIFTLILVLGLISIGGRAFSQSISNTWPWPTNPFVGIGTQLSGGALSALHIHYNSSDTADTKPAWLRLSEGDNTVTTDDWGLLGLMPPSDTTYSSLSRGDDIILYDHQDGDIIISNFSTPDATHTLGGAIRFATTGDTSTHTVPPPAHRDMERITILGGDGDIGIDLPPNDTAGLGTPYEQLQLGGGSVAPVGYLSPIPGLTFYGGNRSEGKPWTGGPSASVDYRFIDFNYCHNPWTGVGTRLAPMAMSGVAFSDVGGGLVELEARPYTLTHALSDLTQGINLDLTGDKGLSLFTQDSSVYNTLFEIWKPGFLFGPVTRNVNGLCFHHTPVIIDTSELVDFTNFTSVHPDIGDGLTWMLAVKGPALFQEAFVSTDWPDYVFDPSYKLPPLGDVENFYKTNRHLPDIPPATKMAETGVPLGRTEAAITKQMEEMMLYITQLNHKIETLEAQVKDLKQEKGK